MKTIEKKNARIIFNADEMATLCEAYNILCNIRDAMEQNKAPYVNTDPRAHDLEDVESAVKLLDDITSVPFDIDECAFGFEIADDI